MKHILSRTTRALAYCIGILGATAIFLGVTSTELAAQIQSGGRKVPALHKTKTFRIYAKKGNFKTFSAFGKLLENKDAKDFRNGELLFIIIGPNKAIFSTNTGVSEVDIIRDRRSVTFIETTLSENWYIMIIEDELDAKEKGFKFTYTCSSEDRLKQTHRSVYSGIAKPIGQQKRSDVSNQEGGSLRDIRGFSIFEHESNMEVFDYDTGELIKNVKGKNLPEGAIQFTITGPNSATLFGNLGSAEVKLVKNNNSVTFIEITPIGNKHIMFIGDGWNAEERGFKFTYIRHLYDESGRLFWEGRLRTISSGIAKPIGY